MLKRHFPFGRISRIGMLAVCALTAGWIAGRWSPFIAGPDLEVASLSLPPEYDVEQPLIPPGEANAIEGDLAKRPPEPTSQANSSLLAPGLVSQEERDLTGFAEAVAFYKTGNLAHGDLAAASAKD